MQVLMGGNTKFVKLTDHNITDSDLSILPDNTSAAGVVFTFSNTGTFTCERTSLSDLTFTGEWLVAGTASNWEIRFTGTGWSTGTFSSWLSLGTTRSVSLTTSQTGVGESDITVNATVEIRRIGASTNEASCVITANASATVEP
jgi:hypothetical protein